MANFGRYFLLGCLFSALFLGYLIHTYFGVQLGLAVVVFLCVGGVVLSLVMSGNVFPQEDDAVDDFGENATGCLADKTGSPRRSGNLS